MSDEKEWGAQPGNDTIVDAAPRIGAEHVYLKMKTAAGEDIEVNLLQVINQLFIDMGHFDMRVRALEGIEEETPLIQV